MNSDIPSRFSRLRMMAILVVADITGLLFAFLLAVFLRAQLLGENPSLYEYLRYSPLILFFLIIYIWRGLYPGVGLSPVDEIRLLAGATSYVFLILVSLNFWSHTGLFITQIALVFAWIMAIIIVQFNRWAVRVVARKLNLWGEPVVIVGSGPESQSVIKYIEGNIHLGFRLGVTIDGYGHVDEATFASLKRAGIRAAILVLSEMSENMQNKILDERRFGFQHLYIISSLGWVGSLGIVPHDLEGILALELRQNLLHTADRFGKRFIDIILSLLILVFTFPLLLVIALLIKLDSPGPLFYQHERVGKNEQKIRIWKFRTMVEDADLMIEENLREHPEMHLEWNASQKLKKDPRITRIGRILRKFSLDELPQLWNILKGEMSLVGPRPIVLEEVKFYKDTFRLYKQIRPGLTGLWQVSGRNDLEYAQRVHFDEYYIRNWSVWLDIYILIRTVWVVLRRQGAY